MTTSTVGMKAWSENVVMRGPGSHLGVKSQEHAAKVLADSMCAGRTIILTHEEGLAIVQKRAAAPDQFIRDKVAEFARGESGLPGRVPATGNSRIT
jgi:hypothetical protein